MKKTRPKKISKAAMIRKANRKRPPSSFELAIHQVLREEGIPFIKEKTVGRCHCDIFIEPNIVVEAQGCYWHGHTRCQKELNDMQRKSIEKDGKRFYFYKKLGMTVLAIWECDFKKDPETFRKRVREAYESVRTPA